MAAAALKHPARKRTVLIALPSDDEREMYDTHLRFEGFAVELARDGSDLQTKVRRLQPHAVIIGQRLHPGWEQICHELKSDPQTSHVPVVLIASYRVGAGRFDAALVRPVLPPVLSNTLRTLLNDESLPDGDEPA